VKAAIYLGTFMFRHFALLGVFVVMGMSQSCTRTDSRLNIDASKAIRVRLFHDGRVELNGDTASMDELTKYLQGQKGAAGAHVLYYRETRDGEPPANWKAVITAIADARLPIRMSTKPDFSDSVVR
jgi:hypothetical protein